MNIPLGETVHFEVLTCNPSTGQAADADSAPTFEVFEESQDSAVASGTMTGRNGKTGDYRGTFDATSAGGFESGKWYSVVVSATVAGVVGKRVAVHFRVVAAEATAGVPAARVDNADEVADALLARSVSHAEAEAAEHSLSTLVLAALESSFSGTTWTIKRTDGLTTHVAKNVTVDPGAAPVTGVE